MIENGLTLNEAKKMLAKFEADDKEDGTFIEDFYEIVPEN